MISNIRWLQKILYISTPNTFGISPTSTTGLSGHGANLGGSNWVTTTLCAMWLDIRVQTKGTVPPLEKLVRFLCNFTSRNHPQAIQAYTFFVFFLARGKRVEVWFLCLVVIYVDYDYYWGVGSSTWLFLHLYI